MKKVTTMIFLAMLIAAIFPGHIFAQGELKLENIETSFGRGVLATGIDINIAFKSENTTFRLSGNQTRVHGRFQMTKLIPMIKLGVTAGFYKDAAWGGLQIVFQPVKFFSTTHWYGLMAGTPDNPGWTINEFINYHAITISESNFDATYTILGVTGVWKRCVDLKYTQMLNSTWKCYVATGYDMTNKIPLYSIGIRYTVQ